jgi:hypothetical protein
LSFTKSPPAKPNALIEIPSKHSADLGISSIHCRVTSVRYEGSGLDFDN